MWALWSAIVDGAHDGRSPRHYHTAHAAGRGSTVAAAIILAAVFFLILAFARLTTLVLRLAQPPTHRG